MLFRSCTTFSVPDGVKGRLWLDPVTFDILRLEEGLKRPFEVRVPDKYGRLQAEHDFTVDRVDASIRYRSVTFHDPDETVLLPESIESQTVIRGGGHVGNRTTQRFSDCRRFLTTGRVIE